MSSLPSAQAVRLVPGRSADLAAVMAIMNSAFDPRFGEAWTRSQCAGILPMTGVSLMLAHDSDRRPPIGFSLFRTVAGEAELLLLAVAPDHQRAGIGRLLLAQFVERVHFIWVRFDRRFATPGFVKFQDGLGVHLCFLQ